MDGRFGRLPLTDPSAFDYFRGWAAEYRRAGNIFR